MNAILMEELLNEDEGTTIDFKRDQYAFDKATDDEKSELLKDILSFGNAWRRTDAYILVGVEDAQGGRSNVVGLTSSFDDAKIQQFVNSKTNRPVTFSYEVFPFEGSQIGIFHIPLQDRPIYLLKDFGKLKKSSVYIRRGSSTDTASPDEIAKMGEVKIRGVMNELPAEHRTNPIVEALQKEFTENNVVLVESWNRMFGVGRDKCTIVDVNELYVTFRLIDLNQKEVSHPISQISVSFDPSLKMKLFIVAPIFNESLLKIPSRL